MNKTYLGDSVYAGNDGFHVLLMTNNGGTQNSNTIYLDEDVISALFRYIEKFLDVKIKVTKNESAS